MKRFSVLFLILILAACSIAQSEYKTASDRYNSDAKAYGLAFDRVLAAHTAGKLSASQEHSAAVAARDVRDADTALYGEFMAWKSSGQKPADFDALAQLLRDKQQMMIEIDKEIR